MSEGFEEIITSINKQLEEETTILNDLKTQTAKAQGRVTKLQRAARDLTADAPSPRKRGKSQPKAKSNWSPRPENAQEILNVLATASGPLTVREIKMVSGRSQSHVDNTVRYLREQEQVRLAGKRGMANLYAPMPNGQIEG